MKEYFKWKRKNVTLRGIKEFGKYNDVYGSFGDGLYTVPLSNKAMAKQYGNVYYVVNAIPKNPKIVNSLNDAELLRQRLVNDFCKSNNHKYSLSYFNENTNMTDEMLKLGYDGLIIKSREMVNYKPENVKYFKTEDELIDYYQINNKNNDSIIIIAYHGTRYKFNNFVSSYPIGAIGNPKGVYFTKDYQTAVEYAEDVDGALDDKSRVIQVKLTIDSDSDGKIINHSYRGEEIVMFNIDKIEIINDNVLNNNS